MHTPSCGFWRCANSLGIFFVLLFALCFAWYFIHPVEPELHMQLFRSAFFGWSGMNLMSFIFGAIQVYLWAYVGLALWMLAGCCFKTGSDCQK